MGDDSERLRARDALLDAANDALFDAVMACEERMPRADIAAFIRGSAAGVEEVLAGPRDAIADEIRKCARRKGELDPIAKLLAKREPGFMPCAFYVKLADGTVDVSVVALRLDPVH